MVSTDLVAVAAMGAAIAAVELFNLLDQSSAGTMASAHAPPLDIAVQTLLPLSVTVAFFTAIALIYQHLHHAATHGGGDRRLSELVPFVLCASAGILDFFFFCVTPAGGMVDDGALVRAFSMAAVQALPAAATVTFFLAVALVFAHVRAGGGGDGGFLGGNAPAPAPAVRLLTKTTLGAGAVLLGLMAMAVNVKVIKQNWNR
ncbi:hypothetical protein ACP70R_042479 [Stipagrostis hirtigluma subsp. patula]